MDANCPVCNNATRLFDVVDFNKNCEELRGKFLPLSGRPVYYCRCQVCTFTFAPEMHSWSEDRFAVEVYNAGYASVDPDYVNIRPQRNSEFVSGLFDREKDNIRHLDYGGGNGKLSAILRGRGWDSTSFDPFEKNGLNFADLKKFNLITAFEVFEHAADVNCLMDKIVSLMEEDCLVIFSTLLSDQDIIENRRLIWWYASPRNGHISLFSKRSLIFLAEQRGLQFGSFNNNLHCFFRRLPEWAEKLMTGGK